MRRITVPLAIVLFGVLSSPRSARAGGSGVWEDVSASATGLPARGSSAAAYDSARSTTVLFGGYDGNYRGDTWERDASGAWTRVATSGPSARNRAGMAYDSARQVTVLFGGTADPQQAQMLGDTWEWDGSAWSERATAGPTAREDVSLAFDESRGVTVLYGGTLASAVYDKTTYEWDGSSWASKAAGQGPSGDTWLVYDGGHARVLGVVLVPQPAVWAWDGSSWTKLSTAAQPMPTPVMLTRPVFDPLRGRVVVFGGNDLSLGFHSETWEWDGAGWSILATGGPAERAEIAAVWDDSRRRVVCMGGRTGMVLPYVDETWEYHGRGETCADESRCETAACTDGVCCDATCGTCESCAGATDTGLCAKVKGPDPDSCAGANVCGATGACGAADGTACTADAECASTACKLGACCDPSCPETCTETGACASTGKCESDSVAVDGLGARHDCSPFRCESGGRCKVKCGSIDDCLSGLVCNGDGTCSSGPAASDSGSSGGCQASGRPTGASALAALVAGALGLLARRRRDGGRDAR